MAIINNKSRILKLDGVSDNTYIIVEASMTGMHAVSGYGNLGGGKVSIGFIDSSDVFHSYLTLKDYQLPFDQAFNTAVVVGMGNQLSIAVESTTATTDFTINTSLLMG